MRNADFESLNALVKRGMDVNIVLPDGKTALMVAGKGGQAALVKRLLEHGAEVNTKNQNGGTALMFSAIKGDPATVAALLAAGADVNAVGSNGWSAMMVAAVKGHGEIIADLTKHNANPNAADVYGWTPLMRAAHEAREQSVDALLRCEDIDLHVVDDHGATALHHAARGGHAAIAERLVSSGANVAARDVKGKTPIDLARDAGFAELALLLLGKRSKN